MKTIFDKKTKEELYKRINALNEDSLPLWGKMNVSQMIRHCAQWDEMALGKVKYKQSIFGKLFGKIALKDMLKDSPIKKNLPTVPAFKITGKAEVSQEKTKWLALLDGYNTVSVEPFIHPFFGALPHETTGLLAYKHINHHLRQFGC